MVTKTATWMSTLNPDAPLFIPRSFLETEDFSHEWWDLVQSTPAFRDYWLRERFNSMEEYDASPLVDDADEFDLEDLLELEMLDQELENTVDLASCKHGNEAGGDSEKAIISALAGLSVNELRTQQRAWREPLKYHEKFTNRGPRSPRKGCNNQFRIQQPRP